MLLASHEFRPVPLDVNSTWPTVCFSISEVRPNQPTLYDIGRICTSVHVDLMSYDPISLSVCVTEWLLDGLRQGLRLRRLLNHMAWTSPL